MKLLTWLLFVTAFIGLIVSLSTGFAIGVIVCGMVIILTNPVK